MNVPDFAKRYEAQLLIAPATAWFVVFLLLPLLILLYYSFLTYETFSVVQEFSLAAWKRTLLSPSTLSVFGKSLLIGAATVVATLVFGYPVAYYLRFYVGEIVGLVVLLALVIPFWTSPVIRTLGWFPLLVKGGAVNQLLLSLGIIEEPLRWLIYSTFAQGVGYLQNYVVFMFAPIYIVLFNASDDLISASKTLRSDSISTFRRVTFPLSLPGVAIGSIFVFVLSVGNFITSQYLSGGSSAITQLIFREVQTGLNYPAAASLSMLVLLVELTLVFILLRVVDISTIAEG